MIGSEAGLVVRAAAEAAVQWDWHTEQDSHRSGCPSSLCPPGLFKGIDEATSASPGEPQPWKQSLIPSTPYLQRSVSLLCYLLIEREQTVIFNVTLLLLMEYCFY